ncbi:hypothetical protein EGM70_06780 [Enterobacteriaceae bacterium 89]|nr:hypothetical protein [Enterobacteriaceae bacterium 89]
MQEFTFYASVDDKTLYRYQIRQSGAVFYVSMSLMQDDVEQAFLGNKVLMNINRDEVIQECLSHCRRRSHAPHSPGWLAGLRNWLVCSFAVLAFIRLIITKN